MPYPPALEYATIEFSCTCGRMLPGSDWETGRIPDVRPAAPCGFRYRHGLVAEGTCSGTTVQVLAHFGRRLEDDGTCWPTPFRGTAETVSSGRRNDSAGTRRARQVERRGRQHARTRSQNATVSGNRRLARTCAPI